MLWSYQLMFLQRFTFIKTLLIQNIYKITLYFESFKLIDRINLIIKELLIVLNKNLQTIIH